MKNISVAVLAGGKSLRMGSNKALLKFNNDTFLNRIIKEMHSFDEVLVCVDDKRKYESVSATLIEDEHKEIGPIEGIYQALKYSNNEYVFVCATDMPYLSKDIVRYMQEFISSDYDCYVLRDEKRVHPLCSIYSKRMLPILESLINNNKYKLVTIFDMVRTKYIDLEYTCFNRNIVNNVNTKEEYENVIMPITFCVSGIKNSGKTGLIIKLINEFISDGFRVGVIKHDGHDFQVDVPGTDSERFARAGATNCVIYSDYKSAFMKYERTSFDYLYEQMSDVDVIIIEGLKNSDFPKIEVIRQGISDAPVCDPDRLICIATNLKKIDAVNCPICSLDDVKGIYNCLWNYFNLVGGK